MAFESCCGKLICHGYDMTTSFCKRRVAEICDEKLFKEPPPREDCPICFLPCLMKAEQHRFNHAVERIFVMVALLRYD